MTSREEKIEASVKLLAEAVQKGLDNQSGGEWTVRYLYDIQDVTLSARTRLANGSYDNTSVVVPFSRIAPDRLNSQLVNEIVANIYATFLRKVETRESE